VTALVSVEGLSRRFGGLTAVDAVSFEVETGSIVGLVGPNGAGKSTVFALLGGSLRPSRGRIRFNGRDVTGWRPERAARAGVCRTFQVMRPFVSMTVFENVMVGALLRHYTLGSAGKVADHCIELVGLGHKRDANAATLSTGQRKRLEMARAMATGPRLLMLDEVTGGVDQRSIPGLMEVISRLRAEGMTLLVIEHNMRVITGLADRIVALHLGKVIAEGPPSEVMRNKTVVKAYLGGAELPPGGQHDT
jgi:branched-chain amino acid transport system ATP-binding protein